MNNLLKQLQTIWGQLGLNQRITILGAALAVVGGMAFLVHWSSQQDYALLYGRLDESEAAKVVSALEESNIQYQLRGGSIFVPRDKVHPTRMQLASKGIPKGEGVGFEIFDKSNFGISDFVQRANYVRALQGEIARTVAQVEAVESARVMIVLPESRLVVDEKKKATASVFVKVRGNAPLPTQTVSAIRFLVANAVEGLAASNVTVVDNLGNVLTDMIDESSTVGMTQTQLGIRKNLEQYLARKAEDMLNTVLGAGQAVVRVSAELNFDTLTKTEERYDPEGQVPRSTTINDENTDTMTATANGGAPGVDPGGGADTNSVAASPVNSNKTKKKVTTTQFEINKVTSNLVQNGGSISHLSAAVFVAARTEGVGAERRVVPRSPEELEKLRKIVQSALGVQSIEGRTDAVTLEEMPFNDQAVVEMTKQMQIDQKREFWWNLARNAAAPALAVVVLGLFWRSIKKAPDLDIPIGTPVGEGRGASGLYGGRSDRGGQVPTLTVEMLNQLIRENPQNMTHAIRTWMGKPKK
ncbi:MAG TPA: flagellar basal-body MS-ring/collar protein FliF [Methylomirabilota bacterium]|nr:flagellar basal-body MS-ring/collar protein FliF [Methylomirabilota bacterium]